MELSGLLAESFSRIGSVVHHTVDGLRPDQLAFRPGGTGNSIAWLVWHLARIQDDHVAGVAGTGQAWTAAGWAERFGLPFDPADTGYGHDDDDVAAVTVSGAELLTAYYDAVADRTLSYVATLTAGDLERVVDRAWDPPVTLGARLVSVVADDLQHAGQAAYVRGLLA